MSDTITTEDMRVWKYVCSKGRKRLRLKLKGESARKTSSPTKSTDTA